MAHNHTHRTIEDITSRLSECGYRMTPQRELILNAIENSREHISTEVIYTEVVKRYPHVNISTVYRTFDLLKKLDLVTETDLGGGRYRYHPVDKGHHHHLVCQECGATIDLEESALSSLKSLLLQNTALWLILSIWRLWNGAWIVRRALSRVLDLKKFTCIYMGSNTKWPKNAAMFQNSPSGDTL